MDPRDLLPRLRGFSTPFGGLSWNPSQSERDAAHRLVVFLYDRRVLYVPHEAELPEHVVSSVLEIRRELTDIAKLFTAGGKLELKLRAMRAACSHFLDRVQRDADILKSGHSPGHWASWEFMDALGQWRAFMAVYVGMVCVAYRIEPPSFLTKLLPELPDRSSVSSAKRSSRSKGGSLLERFETLPDQEKRRQLAELEEYLATPAGQRDLGRSLREPRVEKVADIGPRAL